MKDIVPRIRSNSFRIYAAGGKDSFGTAFAISQKSLVTAYHVVDPDATGRPEDVVSLLGSTGEKYAGRVEKHNVGADLALLSVDSQLTAVNPFEIAESAPSVTQSCMWGGFPRLIGEPSSRLRYAQGMVSSEVHRGEGGEFFEIDGIFSPGHSGSAVIDLDSGKLVGVVSRSAGGLDELFFDAGVFLEAVNAISSSWNLFEDTREQMEKALGSLDKAIPIIEESFNNLFQTLSPLDWHLHWNGLQRHLPFIPAFSEGWSRTIQGVPRQEVVKILEEKGISVYVRDMETQDTGETTHLTTLRADSDVAWRTLIHLMVSSTALMEKAVDESFQMGIGIASCGRPLLELAD